MNIRIEDIEMLERSNKDLENQISINKDIIILNETVNELRKRIIELEAKTETLWKDLENRENE